MPTTRTPARPTRILFVEDHADTRGAFERLISRFGCTVRTADSCAAALRLAQEEPFDLLIADIGLPDGDGWDLLEQMRRLLPDLRGIVLSGYGMPADVRHSTTAGYARHLTKPVHPDDLRTTIESVLFPAPTDGPAPLPAPEHEPSPSRNLSRRSAADGCRFTSME